MCEVVVEVDSSGACAQCGSSLGMAQQASSFRAPSRPEGAGRREVTTSREVEVYQSPSDDEHTPPPTQDRTSRPDWAAPRRTGERSVVVAAPAGPPVAIAWGAGALLAIGAGFALSYLLA